jgi:hypothetical protein
MSFSRSFLPGFMRNSLSKLIFLSPSAQGAPAFKQRLYASLWQTASILLPSGSRTKAP